MGFLFTDSDSGKYICICSLWSWPADADVFPVVRKRNGDGNGNVKNAVPGRFHEQNNNSAHASRFFVHFVAVPAQLRHEMTKV